jgi:hypothetical protein
MLPVRNKEPPLSEIRLPFSQTLPLQIFGLFIPFEYTRRLHLRSEQVLIFILDILGRAIPVTGRRGS